jgi:hypothetical protein
MNQKPALHWSLRVLVAAVLLLSCVVLYVKTRAVDFKAHAELVDSLRRVQQLNAVLQQEVLATRFGLLNEYDALARSQGEMTGAVSEIAERLAVIRYANQDIDRAFLKLTALRAERGLLLEQFKMQNALLKNSLYYLPTAGDALLAEVARAGVGSPELTSHVHGLVQSTLLHNLLESESLRERIIGAIAQGPALTQRLPPALQAQHKLLLTHAQTVLRQQELVDPLIAVTISADFDRAALALAAAYTDSFDAAVESTNRYRAALYVCVVILLLAVSFIGLKLRQVYANLEIMVADRTRRLQQALQELWGEMELAKKIQTALVPQQPKLENCDVAAVMRPAEQVGGDYYDVVSIHGNEWILIGDVSGHGVPAGLVMMMCQTAVHTVLELEPTIAPEKLLAVVNRSLTANIHRLGEDKYMTINAMFRGPDGTFQYSGMHQDIFIYRAESGTIDEIKADGICLGLTAAIEDKLATGSFRLGEGDVLLLYTDGITEAMRDGRMLDGAGLKEMLRELGSQDAQQIVAGILSRLEGYVVSDDVTALAIKQLGRAAA